MNQPIPELAFVPVLLSIAILCTRVPVSEAEDLIRKAVGLNYTQPKPQPNSRLKAAHVDSDLPERVILQCYLNRLLARYIAAERWSDAENLDFSCLQQEERAVGKDDILVNRARMHLGELLLVRAHFDKGCNDPKSLRAKANALFKAAFASWSTQVPAERLSILERGFELHQRVGSGRYNTNEGA
jgi:hypothetical protein